MRGNISPVVQIISTTAYIALCAASMYVLHLMGFSKDARTTVVLVEVAIGLWSTIWLVGMFSWAIATAFAWLGAFLYVVFTYG